MLAPHNHGAEYTYQNVNEWTPETIKNTLINVRKRLKTSRLWYYLDLPLRGWIDLCIRLKDIKFRSPTLLRVLVKILKAIKPLLNLAHIFSLIGTPYAWRSSETAKEWGNKEATKWRNDENYLIYCGMLTLQTSRIIGTSIPEIKSFKNIVSVIGGLSPSFYFLLIFKAWL